MPCITWLYIFAIVFPKLHVYGDKICFSIVNKNNYQWLVRKGWRYQSEALNQRTDNTMANRKTWNWKLKFLLWSLHTIILSSNKCDTHILSLISMCNNVTLYWRQWYHIDKSDIFIIVLICSKWTSTLFWEIHSGKTNQQ
jgi:hypothetical protein